MAADSYVQTTRQSRLSRLTSSIGGIFLGIVLIAIALPLLFWNEGRAVKRQQALLEGQGSVISISPDRVHSQNDGKLVHLSGVASSDETLTDPEFHVSVEGIRLLRTVEMYQWKELKSSTTEQDVCGGTETRTTYTYAQEWSEGLIDSNGFKKVEGHQNPTAMPYSSHVWQAKSVSVGSFRLSPGLISQMSGEEAVAIDLNQIAEPMRANMQRSHEGLYIGVSPLAPAVGDVRITFKALWPQPISVVARQVGNTLEPFSTPSGGTIELLTMGTVSADGMFQEAQAQNRVVTWVVRGIGFALLFMGFSRILAPLSVMADVVPFVGDLVRMGTGGLAVVLAGILSLLTIAMAWLTDHPLLGCVLLATSAVLAAAVTLLPRAFRTKARDVHKTQPVQG
jgi:hypothetical protein